MYPRVVIEAPTTDDRVVWDVWLSMWWMPSVTAADELGVFDALDARPSTAPELARALSLTARGTAALLGLLASLGFLSAHEERYALTAVARDYLVTRSRFYWGGVLTREAARSSLHAIVKRAVAGTAAPSAAWEGGVLTAAQARQVARFMDAHSQPAAAGLARVAVLDGVTRLLDVGGGSGCFSLALAARHPALRCTVMDLPAMCAEAARYTVAADLADRVGTHAADMFADAWPDGHDGVLFSNVFHDWSDDACGGLAARAHAALPAGGRVFVHELLLDEGGTTPRTAAAFSLLMAVATQGRQFTLRELRTLLETAGFTDVTCTPTHGYHSVVSARRR